jgi:hypothetical protein
MLYTRIAPPSPFFIAACAFKRRLEQSPRLQFVLALAWRVPLTLGIGHLWVRFIYFLSDLHTAGVLP